jgi:hypothetical protein
MNTEEFSERRGREGFAESAEKKYEKKNAEVELKNKTAMLCFCIFLRLLRNLHALCVQDV